MKQIVYKDTIVTIEPKSRFDLYQRLIDLTSPARGRSELQHHDERTFFRQQPIEDTTAFERNRKKVESSLVKLATFLWDYYGLPRDGVIEYGSGATGYFYAILMPNDIKNWLQVEINPNAIVENKRRNPEAQIVEGSYYEISYRNIPIITGLSSFDTASDMPRAIGQVAQALMPAGVFLHIQDIRPGYHCIESHMRKTLGAVPEEIFPSHDIVMGYLVNGQRMTLNDIFRQAIGSAIDNHPDLELIVNDYHTISEMKSVPGYEAYFLNLHFIDNLSPKARRDTTVLVTLAKKKSK